MPLVFPLIFPEILAILLILLHTNDQQFSYFAVIFFINTTWRMKSWETAQINQFRKKVHSGLLCTYVEMH